MTMTSCQTQTNTNSPKGKNRTLNSMAMVSLVEEELNGAGVYHLIIIKHMPNGDAKSYLCDRASLKIQ